jgi:hypothetical protein
MKAKKAGKIEHRLKAGTGLLPCSSPAPAKVIPEAEPLLPVMLTPIEVSAVLGAKLSTLREWRKFRTANRPPFFRTPQNTILYPLQGVKEYLRHKFAAGALPREPFEASKKALREMEIASRLLQEKAREELGAALAALQEKVGTGQRA